jgi:ADP-heptose:LPS heptosyltransferase
MNLSPKKLKSAVVFQNGSIGDFLMSIFLAEMLQKSAYVDHITIVVPTYLNFLRGLIGAYPYISAIEVSRRSGWEQIVKMMQHPNLVIIQPTLGKIPFGIKLLGWSISRRYGSEFLGFQDKGPLCKTLYSKTLVYNTDQLYSENIQNIVRALEVPVLVEVPELKIIPDFKHVQACGLYQKSFMVFHLGASSPVRGFTVQDAREVIRYVLEKTPTMHVVLSGAAAERQLIEEVRNGFQKEERIRTAIGCSAPEIAAFIQSAEFYVGSDTGIAHLACFLQARVIVVAHGATATNWLPFYCPSATVLYRLEEEAAVHQAKEYLDAQRRGRIKPFGTVPTHAICAAVDGVIGCRGNEETAPEMVFRERANGLCNSRL